MRAIRLTNSRRVLRAASITLPPAAALALALWLLLVTGAVRLPRRMVLRATVPHSAYTVELWERPSLDFIAWEYETWLVVRSDNGARWYPIDDKYITFTDTALVFSSALDTVRVEVTGDAGAHMVAEYDLKHQQFQAESQPTVRNRKGWTVLAAAHIH
jgi:hypothetical protein